MKEIEIIKTIKDFDFKRDITYYAKKENVKIYIPSSYDVYITDLSNAMKKGYNCNVYHFNSQSENMIIQNYDFIDLMNENNLYDTVKAVTVYSPFIEVKQDKKVFDKITKTNVVKMLLNGAISKIVCNRFNDFEGQRQSLIDNVTLAIEIMEYDYYIYRVDNIINVIVHNNLNYELYI